jgi:hypothetical protein
MLPYHPYPHNPFSFCNYECTDSWRTSFSVHMTCSLPSCVHYIHYIYKLVTPYGWCYFRSHSSVGWRKHFWTQVSHTLSFIHTNLLFSRAIPKEGFQQCFEQWKCQLIQCIAVQGDNFKGSMNYPCERYSWQLLQGHSRSSIFTVITKLENCTFFLLGMQYRKITPLLM